MTVILTLIGLLATIPVIVFYNNLAATIGMLFLFLMSLREWVNGND